MLELAAAVAAYSNQDSIKDLLAEKINLTMHQYGKNKEATIAIDFMQSRVRGLTILILVITYYEIITYYVYKMIYYFCF